MGCAFDSFSRSWGDRSYIIVLMVLCWLLPTFHNLAGYTIMMIELKKSNINYQLITRNTRQHRSKLFRFQKRVSDIITA